MIPFIHDPKERWQRDHNAALVAPVGIEASVVSLIYGWIQYESRYTGLYHKPISADSILFLSWVLLGRNIQELIKGPIGRLDSETLFNLVGEKLKENGFASG